MTSKETLITLYGCRIFTLIETPKLDFIIL